MNLEFRFVDHGSADYEETVALRDAVLRQPLGLRFEPAQLGAEYSDFHIGCYLDDHLVGCLILTPLPEGEMKMRQVAVDPGMQGCGVGGALVRESERVALGRGATIMTLHARANVVGFYEKLGYHVIGEPFEEVTIPHRKMGKELGKV